MRSSGKPMSRRARTKRPKDVWMHFPGTVLVALGLFCACVVYLYFSLGRYDSQDQAAYHKMMQSQDDSDENTAYTSRQQRKGLQKEIFFMDNGERLQLRLQSVLAELALDHHDGQTDVVEQMKDVTGDIQEAFFYVLSDGRQAMKQSDGRLLIKHADPKDEASWVSVDAAGVKPMQIVRHIEADTAFYYYKNDKFVADAVRVSRYVAPGHTIEEASQKLQPIMSGTASWVEFTLDGKDLNFKTCRMKAKFYSLGNDMASLSDEEVVVIDSELADYDGDKISLQGNVVVEHALGVFSANQMILTSDAGKEKGSLDLLLMNDHVKLDFKDGGQLSCAKANLDYRSLTGTFLSNDQQEDVVYTENCGGKKHDASLDVPLVLKSRRMNVKLAPGSGGATGFSKNAISEMTADDHVQVVYNRDFVISSDHAVYQRNMASNNDVKVFILPGTITMQSTSDDGVCQVSDQSGDLIKASQISIDTINRQLAFSRPKGALHAFGEKQHVGRIDFSADKMLWDDSAGILTLRDKVEVNQNGIGKIATPNEMRFYQDVSSNSQALKGIETVSDTVLTYHDEDKNLCHTLTCSGPVKVDHQKMETRLYALQNAEGKVAEGQQIHFEDARGEIFADRALIKYSLVDHSPVISKIILAGNVKVVNRLPAPDDETKTVLQYALADRVDFSPESKVMIFKATDKSRRVLFFDKSNSLQLSAPALKITRDKATKKDEIKGIGDVRFSFIDSEIEQLRKRLLLEKI